MNKFKRQSNRLLYVISFSVLTAISHSTYAQTNTNFEPVSQQLAREIEDMRIKYQLPSLVVAVNYQGKTLLNQANGFANIEENKAATIATRYSVGSIAKPMTTLAMARLVQQGKLAIDAPISTYGKYQDNWQHLTSKQLASHTAGIVHFTDARHDREFVSVKDHWRPEEAFDVFSHEKLLFTPGNKFQYSSSGYILLSDVLAKASHTSYLKLMEQEVFKPLGMISTVFDSSQADSSVEATYYLPKKADKDHQPAPTKRDRTFLFGGGAYQSTALDLANMAWQMQNENYLNKTLQQQLFTPIKLADDKINPQNYGLGFRIHEMDVSQFVPGKTKRIIKGIHHGGTTADAANAYMLTFPKFGLSIAYTTNSIPTSKNEQDNIQIEMWLWLYKYAEALGI
ncbi:serine hydrolase domain-containing protein [Thalassotalea marina]|uniref:Beta-lactamase-related domain-containing protein n=1 Tax=Thalassotalea marina TaxID=1673741 RepID=A0A919BKX5_9GAMM|nr:serine hydrolase domain-containing protein [Thalassotalea marina]GHF97615.1 hypothetical protein GCM10017161_27270 [Thalassotalea marina]